MKSVMIIGQIFPLNVGINVGGVDAGVPQQLLDGAQIGPSRQEMGGETVTEGVNLAIDSGRASVGLEVLPNPFAAQSLAPVIQKYSLNRRPLFRQAVPALTQVETEPPQNLTAEGNKAFLVA